MTVLADNWDQTIRVGRLVSRAFEASWPFQYGPQRLGCGPVPDPIKPELYGRVRISPRPIGRLRDANDQTMEKRQTSGFRSADREPRICNLDGDGP